MACIFFFKSKRDNMLWVCYSAMEDFELDLDPIGFGA